MEGLFCYYLVEGSGHVGGAKSPNRGLRNIVDSIVVSSDSYKSIIGHL
jgi:hypothetical protein